LKKARGPLSADFARRIIADVAAALEVLHGQGIVHRDVKPGNILVPAGARADYAGVTAKLTDFGIAQMVDGASLTGPESILGTAAYLSPEQVRGTRLRPASDVYSLGLVMLEALTGQRSFPGQAAESAVARLTRPPALPANASPALAHLLSRMTALDPADRPRAAEVASLLREDLVGAITAPDATSTAPTPRAGLAIVAAAPPAPDATAPHAPALMPEPADDLTVAKPAAVLAAAAQQRLAARSLPVPLPPPVPATAVAVEPQRRRFPTLLAVGASALAAAAAGIAISASAGLYSPTPGATAAGNRAERGASASAAPTLAASTGTASRSTEAKAAGTAPRSSTTSTKSTAHPTASPSATQSASSSPTSSGSPTPSTSPTSTSSPSAPSDPTASSTPSDGPTPPGSTEPSSAPSTDPPTGSTGQGDGTGTGTGTGADQPVQGTDPATAQAAAALPG
ncbi:MAG: eukaryotic-like serine/threonine-protein kinase, partial [Microbacteriaceae bacterium]|nr:eukaryotic-like serine/threonine-protein kinase [Microbacteriaceae bacterium]